MAGGIIAGWKGREGRMEGEMHMRKLVSVALVAAVGGRRRPALVLMKPPRMYEEQLH